MVRIAGLPAARRIDQRLDARNRSLANPDKVGSIPYSPLAPGRLTRDSLSERTVRSETDQIAKSKYDATAETDRQVVERVAELAEKHGGPRTHIALAVWRPNASF